MIDELVYGIIYAEADEKIGPNPKLWLPGTMEEQMRMHLGIKSITLLTGDDTVPDDLIFLPFINYDLKGLIKYIQWDNPELRGGVGRGALIIIFKQFNDIIFYKYIESLEPLFAECATKIATLEKAKASVEEIQRSVDAFHLKIINTMNELKEEETSRKDVDAFPDSVEGIRRIDYRFKIILCGDANVGKTSSVLRFTRNAFKKTYLPTIGVNINEKGILLDDYYIQLVIWDIAGQEKFNRMRKHFYQGAEGIFLMFDLTDFKSFTNCYNWYKDINKYLEFDTKTVGFVLGNKNDLERQITLDAGEKMAKEFDFNYFETSALTGVNIEKSFVAIAKSLLSIKLQKDK